MKVIVIVKDSCYYVNPDSSRNTCKYKHRSYREYLKKHRKKRLRGLSLLTDKEHVYISPTHTCIYIYPRIIAVYRIQVLTFSSNSFVVNPLALFQHLTVAWRQKPNNKNATQQPIDCFKERYVFSEIINNVRQWKIVDKQQSSNQYLKQRNK
ncbi:conserved hypothetical protein [Trichinella spiralis]|uniref:hypothetical protein n=1 Tax=Trichinella spiralis TaxID=6334 RepID=UPI0001EFE6DA|nr:conserved hypothetical protein [Trichinella spiralis]